MNWQPFETAPKMPGEILVYREDAGVFTANWTKVSGSIFDYDDNDWCWCSSCGEDLSYDLPTLWSPYPPLPTEGEIALAMKEKRELAAARHFDQVRRQIKNQLIDTKEVVKLAATRFRKANELGDYAVYGGLGLGIVGDAYVLAMDHLKLLDSTPLKDLSNEQWRALGFEWDDRIVPSECSWLIRVMKWEVSFYPHDDVFSIYELPTMEEIEIETMTLGRLRHLIAALQGSSAITPTHLE